MSIGEFASRSGVPASTIRYYEQIGLLPRTIRRSGKRVYAAGSLDRLNLVRLAQSCGFRLDEIRELLAGFEPDVPASQRWRTLAAAKRAELDNRIQALSLMRNVVDRVLQCRCGSLEECGRIAAPFI